ncbi:MAG: flagellar motor protein MotB [Deltaproteobacteria bacterium]|nr:flagellar motor protein MotB [Deltaproteobacteria bacterium]
MRTMAEDAGNTRKRSGEASGPGWEVVYTGFILIMLCFFIMLCSFSTIEKSKVEHFVASFTRAVSVMPGGVKVRPGDQSRHSLPDIAFDQGEMALIFQEIQSAVDELGLAEELSFTSLRNGLVVRLADKAVFNLGVAEISSDAFPLLDKIGAIISKGSYSVEIRGHTDALPIHTHRFPSNWELSTARAVNVLRYFLEIPGISAERLSAAGFGEFQPIVSNESPELRAQNRRVEIIFTLDKENTTIDDALKEDGPK